MNAVSVNITSGRLLVGASAAVGMSAHQTMHAVEEPEAEQADDHAGRDHLRDVPVHVMADLVGEDDFDLFGREFVEQRVAHQHAARAAEAGEHRVGFRRVGAQAQAVDAFDREAGAFGQALHAVDELGVFDRLDFVEQRHDQHRGELAQQHADDEERGRGDQPPVGARVPDDPEQARR